MKKNILSLLFAISALIVVHAQQESKSQKIKEDEVPKVVKENHDTNIGFPAEEWTKINISGMPRYVALVQQMNPSSGKILPHRYRYLADGRLTSTSQYRGNGNGEGSDFFSIYLGTGGVDEAFEKKIAQLVKENKVISFEGFSFSPGNMAGQTITTHRFVLTDQSGKRKSVYFDSEGKEVNMAKYPARRMEAEEID